MTETTEEKVKGIISNISWDKMLGIAFLGALSSVILYIVYDNLGEETKSTVRSSVVSAVKGQLAKFSKE